MGDFDELRELTSERALADLSSKISVFVADNWQVAFDEGSLRRLRLALPYADTALDFLNAGERSLAINSANQARSLLLDFDTRPGEIFTSAETSRAHMSTFQATLDTLTATLAPGVAMAALESAGADQAAAEAARARDQIYRLISEAQDALTAAQEAAAERGTTRLSREMEDLAKVHQHDANRWLVGLGLAMAILGGVAVWLIAEIGDATTSLAVARTSIEKFAVGGLLSYVVFFASRNYRSNRHLATEYRSRATILQVSMALRDSVTEDPAKDAILQAAVVSAFTAPSSGLVKSSASDDESTLALAMLTALRSAR